jgi:hypothetical protein
VIPVVVAVVRGWCQTCVRPLLHIADLAAVIRAGEYELCLIRHRRSTR